jgi:predicted aspartyl protease
VPFNVTDQDLRISLGFPNGRRADFLVDTGYDGELLMSTSTTEYAGLDAVVRRGRQGAVRGIGGEMMQIAFTVDWIEMGGRRFGYVKASTGTQIDLIGSGWLRQFRVTFDFRRRVMWLE